MRGDAGAQRARVEGGGPGREDAVVVVLDLDPHQPREARAQRPRDAGRFVQRVADQQPAGAQARGREGVAGLGDPLRLVHGVAMADEDVLEDRVVAPPVAAQEGLRVVDVHLDAERVELHLRAGHAHHLGVELHAHDLRLGHERAHDPRHASSAQAQHQHAPTPAGREREHRRGDRVPDRAGQGAVGALIGGERLVDDQRTTVPAVLHAHARRLGLSRLLSGLSRHRARYTASMSDPLFASPTRGVVRVALPVPIDTLFSYGVPGEMDAAAQVGCRVLVPFSGRRLCGVIVERLTHEAGAAEHTPDAERGPLSPIDSVVDETPALTREMIEVLARAAREVLCPIGTALAAALPAGSAPRVVKRLALTGLGRAALETGAAHGPTRAVLEALAAAPAAAPALERRIPNATALLAALQTDGMVRPVDVLAGPSVRVRRARFAIALPDLDVDALWDGPLARAPKQVELLRALLRDGPTETGALDASASVLRGLTERGYVRIEEREAPRDVLGPAVEREPALTLSSEQAAALVPIHAAIDARQDRTFLLHGVTGSGKTEVYLRAIARALEAGRQALVLVPEITLTHQILARLRARFGDRLAVLHSGLRPSERLEQWQRLRTGDTPIAVGARSALFAPMEDLGVIVIDEEHDSAYKNEEGFRYHARRLATLRAGAAHCPLILGSATPALETRHAAQEGRIERLVLARRIAGRPLPRVEIVDLEAEKRKATRGRKLILTRPLMKAIAETLEAGGQTILFLNRRGFSTQIFCFNCGHAERCKDCDVALVYHAAEHALHCHYCDYEKPPPEHCGGCGNPDTALLGTGTERLEEEVHSRFPKARVARLDRDTANQRGHVERVLAGLRANEIDILIGTQMVAKGHDFPGVRLVGVVTADLGLHMPDFRASERCFQLLTQVAGRAGRSHEPGRVLLQTFVPDHYAIQPVRTHDYERFYAEEIGHRAELGYPPFGALSQVIVSGEELEATQKGADALAASARAWRARITDAASTACEVLGPAPAPLPRLRGRHRIQIVVKGRDRTLVHRLSAHIGESARGLGKAVGVSVDVDPVNML